MKDKMKSKEHSKTGDTNLSSKGLHLNRETIKVHLSTVLKRHLEANFKKQDVVAGYEIAKRLKCK